MSELDVSLVKRGLWTNVQQGPIMGKTITTDTTTGNLVVALLAILSTLGTGHLWHLLTFFIHQVRANGRPADALFRQQQALLRTLPTPGTVMVDTFKLWRAWKREARRPFSRSLLLIVVAMLFSASTIAASIFSSLVVDTSNLVVLVDSPNCLWNISNMINNDVIVGPALAIAAPYANKCYDTTDTNLTACQVFVRPNIRSTSMRVPCPFADGWCEGGDAISLDSGLIDASATFGLNLPKSSGVKYRKKSTCAVLPLGGNTQVVNMTDYPITIGRTGLPGEQALLLNYGFRIGLPGNATFMTSLSLSNITDEIKLMPPLVHYQSTSVDAVETFMPIPELAHNNSNLMISALSFNSALWLYDFDDPLFSAHQSVAINSTVSNFLREDIFKLADYPMKAIACLQQYQFCYVGTGGDDICTDLNDVLDQRAPEAFPGANKVQQKILDMLMATSYAFSIFTPGALEIDAVRDIRGILIPILMKSNERWIFELEQLQNKLWALLQVYVADLVIASLSQAVSTADISVGSNGVAEKKVVPDEEKILCGSQLMRKSGGIVNINVFGMSFIIAFSLLVAIIDIMLLKFLIFLSRFRRTLAPRIDRWVQDGVWQLQRRAYEGHGYRGWIDLDKDIPMSTSKPRLADWPDRLGGGRANMAGIWRSTTGGSMRSMRSASVRSSQGYGTSPEMAGWI
ncbi:hypothetical protein K504DRAFT_436031 [Pleomassaria siparia CBS 279.74]|uniref:Uncharacterized protein n=1 Tax=Pleomassaria siparia CBS 279.74 TaxID=1314801 RepID=A0A6G1K4V4_9PLEO|nr:hypothetical protein K504DRAFT_436031 [Pleomassaria siparia CBS 279.74]